MRPSFGEVSVALYGAWRLMRFDPNGINYFLTSRDGFWKSFYAAVFCLPGLVISSLATYKNDAGPIFTMVGESLAFFVGLLVTAVVVHAICEVIDRQNHFVRCIVALNWSSVLKVYLAVPVVVLASLDPASSFGLLLLFVVSVFVMLYEGFIFFRALEITGLAAAGFVAANLTISLFLHLLITT